MASSTPRPERSACRRATRTGLAAGALTVLGLLLNGPAWGGSLTVGWHGGSLTIAADDVPRADVLREVARKTGAKVRGLEQLSDRITLRLDAADLGSALRTLAGDGSYALAEMLPRRKGGATQYELFIAERGQATPTRDVLRGQPAVSVLVEDPRTGEMRPQGLPSAPMGYPSTVRPDQNKVSVRIDPP